MEEKSKVSLGIVISVFIIMILVVSLVAMYCYYNCVVIPKYEGINNEREDNIEKEASNQTKIYKYEQLNPMEYYLSLENGIFYMPLDTYAR